MNLKLTDRRRYMLSGAISLLLLVSLASFGVKYSFGALDGGYDLIGSFDTAGQGLIPGSDVKIRGINVGKVSSIRLVKGRAEVRFKINNGVKVPAAVEAIIRPKTLFGEKFIDLRPGPTETTGPFLGDEGVVEHTLGGFELERVLTDAFPVVKAIDPNELMTVLNGFAESGRGLGETINRSLVNGVTLSDLGVKNDAQTRQFLTDLAALSTALADRGDDLVAAADDLNVALPTINERSDELNLLLVQLARLSGDVADVLDNNRAFLKDSVVEGGKGLQVLSDNREQIVPLVQALARYLETISTASRIPLEDGSLMAAVKGILGGDLCAPACPGAQAAGATARTGASAGPAPLPDLETVLGGSEPAGADALISIIGGFGGLG